MKRPKRVQPPFRLFVAGTDTGVGKTQVAAALLSLLADEGMDPAPFKPYESGCPSLLEPQDALTLREASRSGDSIERICPHRFLAPLAPGIAAVREKREPAFETTLSAFRSFDGRPVIAEAAGGLLVPIDSKRMVLDLIVALRMPVVLVARAGLGTLNHTGLSLQALWARKLPVRAVVLSRTGAAPDPAERDNPKFLADRYGVEVLGPVEHHPDPRKRRAAFRRALKPIVESLRPA